MGFPVSTCRVLAMTILACGLVMTADPRAQEPSGAAQQPAPAEQQPAPAEQQPAPAEQPQAPLPQQPATTDQQPGTNGPPSLPTGVPLPPDYVIGPEDILGVVFWRDTDMTADVVVRPDGKITLPLVNDIEAAGLTPDELRARITEAARQYLEAPTVSVVVKEIHSRRVFITGMVSKPGMYPLTTPTTVLQLISIAGGLQEFADTKNIMIMRTQDGEQDAMKFNYKDVRRGKNLEQNILLKPGDTVVVP